MDSPRQEHSGAEEAHVSRPSGDRADNSNFDQFQLFKSYLDVQFRTLKKEIITETENSAGSIAKKLKTDNTATFKFKGNKQQFDFNSGILDELVTLKRSADNLCDREEKVLDSVCDKIKRRKLADKSPGGWETVREYEEENLADDAEDEKRIRQAEYRALKTKKTNRQFNRNANFNDNASVHHDEYNARTGSDTSRSGLSSSRQQRQGQQPFRGPRKPSPYDICFKCGGTGHWRNNCMSTSYSGSMPGNKTETRTADK